jgi:hypothetical protein
LLPYVFARVSFVGLVTALSENFYIDCLIERIPVQMQIVRSTRRLPTRLAR